MERKESNNKRERTREELKTHFVSCILLKRVNKVACTHECSKKEKKQTYRHCCYTILRARTKDKGIKIHITRKLLIFK